MTEALVQTFLQPLRSYAVRTFPVRTLRTSVMQILLSVLYVGSTVRCRAVLGRCGNLSYRLLT